jgi:hypothetical protein
VDVRFWRERVRDLILRTDEQSMYQLVYAPSTRQNAFKYTEYCRLTGRE